MRKISNNKELSEQLEQLYFEGFRKDYWSLDEVGRLFLNTYADEHFETSLIKLEKRLYSDELGLYELQDCEEFIAAKERFENSPLVQALK